MSSDFDTVYELMGRLSAHELVLLEAHAKRLRSSIPGAAPPDTAPPRFVSDKLQQPTYSRVFETAVLSTIVETLRLLNVDFVGVPDLLGVHMLRQTSSYQMFKSKMPQLAKYVKDAKLSTGRQRSLLMTAMRLLYTDLRGMNVPVGGRLMMTNIDRIPSVLDRHFPAYADAGMLGLIARVDK